MAHKLKEQGIDFIELEPMGSEDTEKYKPLRQESKGVVYVYKLFGEVELPEQYLEIIDVLQKATSKDTFILELASDGGYIDGYVSLAHALLSTKAKTVAVVHKAYSAAAMLALTCDDIEVNLFSSMMAHAYSGGSMGKRNELKAKQDFDDRYYTYLTKQIYSTFFTDEEIDSIEGGNDKWLDASEIRERIKNWIPIRKRKGV